jgi:hypothetical protein
MIRNNLLHDVNNLYSFSHSNEIIFWGYSEYCSSIMTASTCPTRVSSLDSSSSMSSVEGDDGFKTQRKHCSTTSRGLPDRPITLLENDPNDDKDDDVLQNDNIRYILQHLNEEEIEFAACTSYEYQTIRRRHRDDATSNSINWSTLRYKYVIPLIQRYIKSRPDPKIALQRIKETLEFRTELNLHDMNEYTQQHDTTIRNFLSDHKTYV